MKRMLAAGVAGLALTAPLTLVTAGAASAAPAATKAAATSSATLSSGECVRAGIGTLKSLGLLKAAATRQIDYSTLADPVNGPIFAELPAGSYLSLGKVVKLHVTNPELFAWCRVS